MPPEETTTPAAATAATTPATPATPAAAATTTTPATSATATPAAPATGTEPDWKAEAEKWKAMARKHEANSKSNAAAAQEAKTLEERIADMEKRNAEAEARALRAEVASEKGVPAKLARYLQGTTREELEASATELAAELKPKAAATAPEKGSRPKENLRPGAVPGAEAEPDYNALAAQIAKQPAFGRR